MKPQTIRAASAVAGGVGFVAMGLIGMTLGAHSEPAPVSVLAPASVLATVDSGGEVTTTSANFSFTPTVDATPPAPPT